MSGKELEPDNENAQRGVKASVDYIRRYRDIWEAEAGTYHRVHTLATVAALVASGSVTAFSSFLPDRYKLVISALGLVAFVGAGISTSFALVKRMDLYWRAWRIVNRALIAYDGGLIDFEKLTQAHAAAEGLFDDYYVDSSERDAKRRPDAAGLANSNRARLGVSAHRIDADQAANDTLVRDPDGQEGDVNAAVKETGTG